MNAPKDTNSPSSLRLVLTLAIAGLVSGDCDYRHLRVDAAHDYGEQGA